MEHLTLNERLAKEFETTRCSETFTRYVMSELLSPIEDYGNAAELICKYYFDYSTLPLIIIGAYISVQMPEAAHGKKLLDVLNIMYPHLQPTEKAIVSYLNAHDIYMHDTDYLHNKKYQDYLEESINFDVPFVYNRYHYSQLFTGSRKRKYLEEAKANVRRVTTEKLSDEYFLNPQNYINEHILGIVLSEPNYELNFEDGNRFWR